jgi:hypothetical protein
LEFDLNKTENLHVNPCNILKYDTCHTHIKTIIGTVNEVNERERDDCKLNMYRATCLWSLGFVLLFMKNNSRCPGWDSNHLAPDKYKSEELPLEPTCLLLLLEKQPSKDDREKDHNTELDLNETGCTCERCVELAQKNVQACALGISSVKPSGSISLYQ